MKVCFIVIGLLFSILSIVLSYVVIDNNNKEIVALEGEVADLEKQIDFMWQDSSERQLSMQNVVLYLSNNSMLIKDKVIRDVFNIEANSIEELLEMLRSEKATVVDEINDKYLEIVVLKDKVSLLEFRNKNYRNGALLLNIIGLIFILLYKELSEIIPNHT